MQFKVSTPLSLSGTYNTRDLGGYPAIEGKITREKRILRSDGLQSVTKSDKEFLYSYGVRTIIDMRSKGELLVGKCAMKTYKDIKYYHVPLLDHIHSESDGLDFPDSLREMYIDLLENSKASIYKVLKIIAENSDACVLYNCMAGKDRTGIISTLLLMNSGVCDDAVLVDYAATAEYLVEFIKKRRKFLSVMNINIPDYLFASPKEEMGAAIIWLKENYGTAADYMRNIGLSDDEIEKLKL